MINIINTPPKLSEISSKKLQLLDEQSFACLRKNIKKRNKKRFNTQTTKKIDRKLILKKYPNKKSEHINIEKSQIYTLYRECKPSEILDFFNPNRGKNWKKGKQRKKVLEQTIEIKNFSFIDFPNETLELFYRLASYEPYIQKASADFADSKVCDIAPYLLWGIVKKEMYPYIKGGKIQNRISNVIKGLDLDRFMSMSLSYADDRNIIALPPIWKPRRPLIADQQITTLDISATRLVNKINEWLVNLEPPMQLSEEGCVNVTTFAIEILENAQRHSVKDEEGNWYMTAFMEYRDNQYFCSLSFINTGIPIYESILSTSNPIVAKELHDYIAHHSNIDKAILSTVYALQDGSTRQNYKGSRGGIGMLRMVKFINEIGYTELVNEKPVIAIISGNVYIKFSDQYGNAVKKEDNRHYQWFNPSQDRSEKPDHNHAFLLKRTFPGTIITTRFMLDAESLSKKVKKNDNN